MFIVYKFKVGPIKESNDIIEFQVIEGDTYYLIADRLYEQGLINSIKWYKIHIKLTSPKDLKLGNYSLSKDMGIQKIIEVLENDTYNEDINITFKEGDNMRFIANTSSKYTNNKQDSLYDLLSNKEYIGELINKYWFLKEDILNEKIYYSLEGYLFPDTYSFTNTDVDIKTIIETMLDNMDKKLTPLKNDIEKSGYTVHEILTMASIVEKEAANANDRSKVAGVLYNRINTKGETLGSDVTAYYGAMMDDWTNGLGSAEVACNGYNTRLNSKCPINGLPVGPIASPSLESIKASLYPKDTNAMFFVADCSGNVYLTNTYNEHTKLINKLVKEGNWCDK